MAFVIQMQIRDTFRRTIKLLGEGSRRGALARFVIDGDLAQVPWEAISDDYLRKFEKMYTSIEQKLGAKGKLANRFFGVNAVNYLGLGANQPARVRLDNYYRLTSKPAWMAKVDKLPVSVA